VLAPGVTDNEIKLGMLYSQEGATASAFAPFRGGADARLGVANAEGGVRGRKIVYDWEDDVGDPARNGASARYLVEQRKVFGILSGTAASFGSADYLDRAGVPVTGISLDPSWTEHGNMFRLLPLDHERCVRQYLGGLRTQ
jgi:ABC-type branched-subunit amino acid transport system substrate-binding protein